MLSFGIYASAATIVTPTVTLNSISNRNVNTTVTVTGNGTAGTSVIRSISNDKMKRYLEGENPYIICARQ